MFFAKTFAAVSGLATLASGHMLMGTPAAFTAPKVTNGPLDATGSNFPCQQTSGGSYVGDATSMALGSDQPLSFIGTAVHGGGSCQVSITYDESPTASSVWKVITSIEGGCPAKGQAGNMGDDADAIDPYTYNFTIPSDIPTGKATLAWTWFNKVGNREMYMNCAPIEMTGTSGDQASYDALPDMFTANIGNGCSTADGDLKFPDAGDVIYYANGDASELVDPVGSCGTSAAGTGSAGTSAAGTSPTTTAAASTAAATTADSIPGGVFITTAAAATTTAAPATTAAATSTSTSAAAATTSASSSSGSSSSSGAQSGACTTEGEWNCIDGSTFQQCAAGTWSAAQSVASGTTCTVGQSASINIVASSGKTRKLAVRFRG